MLKRNPKISKHVAFVSCAAGISRSHQDLSFSSFATGFFSIQHARRTTSLACSPSFHHEYEMWLWHVMNRDTTLPYSADRSWNKPLSFAHSSCLFAQQEIFQDLHDCYLWTSRVLLQFLYVEGWQIAGKRDRERFDPIPRLFSLQGAPRFVSNLDTTSYQVLYSSTVLIIHFVSDGTRYVNNST